MSIQIWLTLKRLPLGELKIDAEFTKAYPKTQKTGRRRSPAPIFLSLSPLDSHPKLALFYTELTRAGSLDPVIPLVIASGLGLPIRAFLSMARKQNLLELADELRLSRWYQSSMKSQACIASSARRTSAIVRAFGDGSRGRNINGPPDPAGLSP